MELKSARSSFLQATFWFPETSIISFRAASAFSIFLQAIMTLIPRNTDSNDFLNQFFHNLLVKTCIFQIGDQPQGKLHLLISLISYLYNYYTTNLTSFGQINSSLFANPSVSTSNHYSFAIQLYSRWPWSKIVPSCETTWNNMYMK